VGSASKKASDLSLHPELFPLPCSLPGQKKELLSGMIRFARGDLGMEMPLLFNVSCLPLNATLKIYSLMIKIDEAV